MFSTPEKIEELLRPYKYTLRALPRPGDDWAYDVKDRVDAIERALAWQDTKDEKDFEESVADFICHQSDVIEMLTRALELAQKRGN